MNDLRNLAFTLLGLAIGQAFSPENRRRMRWAIERRLKAMKTDDVDALVRDRRTQRAINAANRS